MYTQHPQPVQYKTLINGEARGFNYDIPEIDRPRETRPNAFQRIGDKLRANPGLTSLGAMKATGITPEGYNAMMAARRYKASQYPAEGLLEHAADFIGNLGGDTSDPIGWYSAGKTMTPGGAGGAGAAYSSVKSALSDTLEGKSPNFARAALAGVAGYSGARIGDKSLNRALGRSSGSIGEIAGRSMAGNWLESVLGDASASVIPRQ
jgi:hypothetical protein